ncbi:MAG TPA: hypothetical protein VEH51_15405 [Burkholderiales bacterium]|nr:hypothetical protein [Burkholderiales bacterium]
MPPGEPTPEALRNPPLRYLLATRELWRHAAQPAQLGGAIELTVVAAPAHGLLLSAALMSA